MNSINEFTNDAFFWEQLGLDQAPHIFWRLNHEEPHLPRQTLVDLTTRLNWKDAEKIILFDCEGFDAEHNLNFDSRIHMIQPIKVEHDRHYFFPWWYEWMLIVEQQLEFHKNLQPENIKQPRYTFDAMLGTPWPNKKWVAEKIKQAPEKFLWNLGVPWNQTGIGDKFLHGTDLHTTKNWARPIYNNRGDFCNHGLLLPWKIYNDSWFSIILETCQDKWPMLTEKSGKCLLGRRLFINFGNPGVLKLIRELGYQTFDSVIDESYDSEPDHDLRFESAWNQVEHLLNQPPESVAQKIKPILDHNQKLFLTSNYARQFHDLVKEINNVS